jgi:hypothetical protein
MPEEAVMSETLFEVARVVHLTETGLYAGSPICGAVRGDSEGAHFAYVAGDVIRSGRFADGRVICAACCEYGVRVLDMPVSEDDLLW